jgi:hypothetical protein
MLAIVLACGRLQTTCKHKRTPVGSGCGPEYSRHGQAQPLWSQWIRSRPVQLRLQLQPPGPASLVLRAYRLSRCRRKSDLSVRKQERACAVAAETIYKRTVAYSLRNPLRKLRRSVRDRKKEVRLRLRPRRRKRTLKRCSQITLKPKIREKSSL